MNKLLWVTVALNLSLMGGACSDDRPSESSGTEAVDPGKADSANEDGTCKPASYARNWGKNPAVVRIADRQRTLYALSDVHGEPVDLFEMLESAGLVSGSLKKPAWIGGKSVLVLAGDSLNKGDRSLDVLDLLMKLEEKAKDAGGALIALAGNHEIAFLAYPTHPKLAKILQSAEDKGLSLCKDVHSPRSAYGAWLRNRPIAAVINGIFISHSGNTRGMSIGEIEGSFEEAVDEGSWDSGFACGTQSDGFFNRDQWWVDSSLRPDASIFDRALEPLEVRQMMFGHDPGAFDANHQMEGYFGDAAGRALIKLDMAISAPESRGSLYQCADWRDDGGCLLPRSAVNPEPGNSAFFSPLTVHQGDPPLPLTGPEVGDWCTGKGHQSPY